MSLRHPAAPDRHMYDISNNENTFSRIYSILTILAIRRRCYWGWRIYRTCAISRQIAGATRRMPTAATRIAHLGHVLQTAQAKRMGAAMLRRMERVIQMRMVGVRRSGVVRHSRCVKRDFYTRKDVCIHGRMCERLFSKRDVCVREDVWIHEKDV